MFKDQGSFDWNPVFALADNTVLACVFCGGAFSRLFGALLRDRRKDRPVPIAPKRMAFCLVPSMMLREVCPDTQAPTTHILQIVHSRVEFVLSTDSQTSAKLEQQIGRIGRAQPPQAHQAIPVHTQQECKSLPLGTSPA